MRPLLIRTRCIIPLFILITPLRLPEIVSLIVCDPVRTPKADAYMHILLCWWWGALPLHNRCVWKVRDGVLFWPSALHPEAHSSHALIPLHGYCVWKVHDGVEFSDLLLLSLSLSLSLFYLPPLSFYKKREGERVCAQQPNLISLGTPPHYKQEAAPLVECFPHTPDTILIKSNPMVRSQPTQPHYKQEAAPSVVSIFPLQPCIQDATKPSLMMQQINHTPHNSRPE